MYYSDLNLRAVHEIEFVQAQTGWFFDAESLARRIGESRQEGREQPRIGLSRSNFLSTPRICSASLGVGLFGPTSSHRWGYRFGKFRAVQGRGTMDAIQVDEVCNALRAVHLECAALV
jgi:hypothetical protein